MGVRRVAVPLARHQDREQQPVRPRQHKPKGVQEGPKAGKKTKLLKSSLVKIFLDERGPSIGWGTCRARVKGNGWNRMDGWMNGWMKWMEWM